MNTLRDSKAVNSPDPDMSAATATKPDGAPSAARKPKTPLKKDELEKIARELKHKLARASVAAKQLLAATPVPPGAPGSPHTQMLPPKSSPLKNYSMWKRHMATGAAGALLLPPLYLPDRKLPTLTKPSVFLSSSPLKSIAEGTKTPHASDSDAGDSPLKRRRGDSGAVLRPEPHVVLEEMPRTGLHPAPVLSSHNSPASPGGHTTPTLPKRQLAHVLKTPTQRRDAYNDDEGADLLMYLATSPSPAKTYGSTPRAASAPHGVSGTKPTPKPASALFVAPPPPLTPKRPVFASAKTPQSRVTPSVYGTLAVPGSALPSAGLALTPAGFNMSDYVNFFTPSPSAAASQGSVAARSLLKTPDFHGLVQPGASKTPVDGKMINFDKVGLFGLSGTDAAKE